jgi:hypothetical protein
MHPTFPGYIIRNKAYQEHLFYICDQKKNKNNFYKTASKHAFRVEMNELI